MIVVVTVVVLIVVRVVVVMELDYSRDGGNRVTLVRMADYCITSCFLCLLRHSPGEWRKGQQWGLLQYV